MKKMVLFLAGVAVACTALAGCQGTSDTAEETESVSQEESAEPEEYELPDGFSVLTDIQEEELIDIFGDDVLNDIVKPMNAVISELGIETIEHTVYGNYDIVYVWESSDIVTIDCYVVTDIRNMIFSIRNSSGDWSVFSAEDAETGHYYWINSTFSGAVDLYDYSTGKLVSKKHTVTDEAQEVAEEPIEEDEDSIEEVEEEYDEELDDITEEVTHREGMYGVSDKDVHDIDGTFSRNAVRNDTTGNWKVSTIAANVQMEEYALSYYNWYFRNDDEIHCIVNFNYNTTTCIQYMSGMIYVTVYDYVDGEEHDANIMFTGTVLAEYIVYPDNGDIEKIQ